MSYYDELEMLRIYIAEKFPQLTLTDIDIPLEKRRKISSKHWGAFMAYSECYNVPFMDPIDKLEYLLNNMNIEATFASQSINKKHYSYAAEAIEEMINFLKERRK